MQFAHNGFYKGSIPFGLIIKYKYYINSKMHSNGYKNQFRIYIPRRDAQILAILIKPYLIESMLYKIDLLIKNLKNTLSSLSSSTQYNF
jgi:hypothetical protein